MSLKCLIGRIAVLFASPLYFVGILTTLIFSIARIQRSNCVNTLGCCAPPPIPFLWVFSLAKCCFAVVSPVCFNWQCVGNNFFEQNSMPNNFYLNIFWLQCVFSAMLSPKWNVFFAVSINVIFQPYKSFEFLSSTQEEIDICPRGLLWTKFNAKRLLFEDFFGCDAYFWQHWALNGMYLAVSINVIFQPHINLSST